MQAVLGVGASQKAPLAPLAPLVNAGCSRTRLSQLPGFGLTGSWLWAHAVPAVTWVLALGSLGSLASWVLALGSVGLSWAQQGAARRGKAVQPKGSACAGCSQKGRQGAGAQGSACSRGSQKAELGGLGCKRLGSKRLVSVGRGEKAGEKRRSWLRWLVSLVSLRYTVCWCQLACFGWLRSHLLGQLASLASLACFAWRSCHKQGGARLAVTSKAEPG